MKAAWRWFVRGAQAVGAMFSLAWRAYLRNMDEWEEFRKKNPDMAAQFDNEKGVWP